MTMLLKGDAARDAAPVQLTRLSDAPVADLPDEPVLDPRTIRIAELEAALAATQAAERGRDDAQHAAIEAAYRRGLDAGLAQAEQDEAARVAQVERCLEAANEAFAEALAGLEALAPALARRAVERLWDRADWADFAGEAVLAQVRRLGSSVISVAVSPELEDVLGAKGLPGVTVDPLLPDATARIRCRLGDMDIDLERGWKRLADRLDQLADQR